MEVVVGDITDYRERLHDEDAEVIDRLEKLKQEENLLIYTCPSKTVHSKMYIIEDRDGNVELLTGSANLTRSGWTGQTNHMAVVRTNSDSDLYASFLDDYEFHRDQYGELFLEDLTEKIEESDREREEVIRFWVEGKSTTQDDFREINTKAVEQIRENKENGQLDRDIVLSLQGYNDSVQETVEESFDLLGGSLESDTARISPSGYSRFLEKTLGLPLMDVNEHGVDFVPPGENLVTISQEPNDSEDVRRDLEKLHDYFETVDRYGETNRATALKSYLYEALLFFFWAPFINLQADFYLRKDIDQLEKNLPYLYLYGESNSGKGTFCRYALSLISNNRVKEPLDADEINRRAIRNVRRANSAFPLVVDDIDKRKINGLEPLKNFWSGWDPSLNYPALIFVSNDRKPDEWFRNRAKILHFDVMFRSTKKGEAEVNRLIKDDNKLFGWFSHRLHERYRSGELELSDDVLAPARRTMTDLYDRADVSKPEFFPQSSAEEQHDVGRRKWNSLRDNRAFTAERDGENLRLRFRSDLEHWEIQEYRRHLPSEVRAEQQGTDLIVKNPDEFRSWLNKYDDEGFGLFNQLKKWF